MRDVAAKIPEAYEWRESAFVGPSVGDDEAGPARGVNWRGSGPCSSVLIMECDAAAKVPEA